MGCDLESSPVVGGFHRWGIGGSKGLRWIWTLLWFISKCMLLSCQVGKKRSSEKWSDLPKVTQLFPFLPLDQGCFSHTTLLSQGAALSWSRVCTHLPQPLILPRGPLSHFLSVSIECWWFYKCELLWTVRRATLRSLLPSPIPRYSLFLVRKKVHIVN